jgi:hypothetical protein
MGDTIKKGADKSAPKGVTLWGKNKQFGFGSLCWVYPSLDVYKSYIEQGGCQPSQFTGFELGK